MREKEASKSAEHNYLGAALFKLKSVYEREGLKVHLLSVRKGRSSCKSQSKVFRFFSSHRDGKLRKWAIRTYKYTALPLKPVSSFLFPFTHIGKDSTPSSIARRTDNRIHPSHRPYSSPFASYSPPISFASCIPFPFSADHQRPRQNYLSPLTTSPSPS